MDLIERWRKAAVDRWYGSQDHVGQADTNPNPYVEAAADAAVGVVLERLIDRAKTHGDSGAVEAMYWLEAHMAESGDSSDG